MQIVFTFQTPFGSFCDALHLPADHGLTEAQLESMKQERLTNWLSMVNPSPEQIEASRLQQLALDETTTEPTEES